MELAGEGALLKMLEDRKKKLAAEGLFNADRKRPIPRLPQTIGVITSPTGAVIRDILHRLRDRFPRHVLLWPALVQGQGAAQQVTDAINGFQNIQDHGFPRPDVLIVARGGGSLEDLMPFNEENVVRAVAASAIPVISAVGHETDTTLCDFAADLRAPTPTGAAEMAVPVRAELLAHIKECDQRLLHALTRRLDSYGHQLTAHSRGLGDPAKLLEIKTQRLDFAAQGIMNAYQAHLNIKHTKTMSTAARLISPQHKIQNAQQKLDRWADGLSDKSARLFDHAQQRLAHASQMLEAYSFENVLKRGFAVIRDPAGKVMTSASDAQNHPSLEIQFAQDQRLKTYLSAEDCPLAKAQNTAKAQMKAKAKTPKPKPDDKRQTSLF